MTNADLIDRPTVPTTVEDKLATFRDISSERNAAQRGSSEEMRTALHDVQSAQARMRVLERDGLKDNHPSVVETREKVARGERAVAKFRERVEKLRPGWEWAHRLCQQLEGYVRAHAAGGIALHAGETPQLRDGERALDGLDRAARRTRTLLADRREVLAAPFPSSLAKKLAWKQMEGRIEAAKPDVTGLIDRCEQIKFPANRASIEQHGGSQDVYANDPIGTLGWIFPTEVRAAIDREIDAVSDDEIALSPEERAERLARIDGDLLASEREEAAFAELAGLLPRADIDPRAVLQLAGSMPAPERD